MGIFDTLLGKSASDAANSAAADTYGKQQAAIGATRQAGSDYLSGLLSTSKAYDPYVSAGGSALTQLLSGLGLGGDSAAFANAYRSLPGYQSGLDTGTRAVTARLNAGSGVQSGAAMKALQKFGSDYEDQRAGDYLSRLASLAGAGLQATGAQAGTQAQGYGGQLQANLGAAGQQYGSSGTIGQGQIAGANAESSALGNLLAAGGYLGGQALGGGFGTSFGKYLFGK